MGDEKPRLVLSIDGGGCRGLACLIILSYLVTEITGDEDTPPCEIFDLVCGTSTGGLIATLLGRFGLSCGEAIEVYKEVGATMFGGESDSGKIWGNIIQGSQFSAAMFEKKLGEIIDKYTGSKNTLFKPAKNAPDTVVHESTKTFVTVVSRIGALGVDAYRIRSYQTPSGGVAPTPFGHKWTIFQAARGTCATPLYFPPLQIQSGRASYPFQDAGSSGFNNPSKIAMDEARKVFGSSATIVLVSLGTGLRNLVKDGQYAPGAKVEVAEEHVTSFAHQILSKIGDLGRNIRDAPQTAKRVAHQLLEVATDTEISHLHTFTQYKRRIKKEITTGSILLKDSVIST